MPEIGNNYVYKTNGVCTLAAEEDRSGTKFYKLIPIFETTLSIFVPEDKAQLRTPMTKEQAEGLLLSIKDMESVWIEDSRERRKPVTSTSNSYSSAYHFFMTFSFLIIKYPVLHHKYVSTNHLSFRPKISRQKLILILNTN